MAMLDDENLYLTSEYTVFDVDVTFYVEEGDLSYNEDTLLDNGVGRSWDVSPRLVKGDFVELVPDKRLTVKKATGSKPVFGQLISNPQWVNGTRYPKRNAEAGDYNMRVATVRIFGCYVHELPLVTENVAIQSGDSLAFDATEQAFDKSTKDTKVIAIEPIGALKTGKIATVMGFYGGLNK